MRLLEVKQPNIIVVYGGGFQPFHEGHASSYREAKAAFPGAYFFVAASNVTSERPFEFKEKQFLAKQAGVSDPFIQVGTMSYVNDNGRKVTSTPLNPLEVLQKFNPEKDVLIIVRSERDPMKTTDVSYYQPWQGIQGAEPFSKHAYIFVTKKHDFSIAGNPVYSGSQVRELYSGADDKTKLSILQDLYPQSRQLDKIKQIFDKRLVVAEGVSEDLEHYDGIEISMEKENDEIMVTAMMSGGRELGHVLFIIDGEYLAPQDLEVDERYQGQGIAATMYDYVKSKGYKIRRSGQQTDAGAGFWDKHKPGKNVWEQGVAEGWSQKYKSSINCSHPKGFSQKAHCAGKKKHNESHDVMEMTCPDCGMCQTHGNVMEIKKGAKDSNGFTKCWPGHHAAGTKKGKNGGQVRNCVPNESQGVAEEGYGNHPSQRVDPRTGKKYVPPRSPLGQGVAEGSVTPDVTVNKVHDDGHEKEWHIYRGKEMIGYVTKNQPDTAEGLYIAYGHGPGRAFVEEFTGLKPAVNYIASLKEGVVEDSLGLKKLHDALWTVISEQTIDEETINEIDPGMIANLYSVFPTVAKIIVSNALNKARKEAKETSLMIDVMKKHANNQPVTPQENEAMLGQFKDIVSYGLSAVAGVLTGAVAGPAAGVGVALAGAYKKELLTLLQTKGPEVLIGLLKSKGKLDVVDILSAKLLGKHALPFYAPAKLATESEQKTVAKTWDQMTSQEKSSGVKGRTVWNEKTQRYYTVFDVPANEVDEASLATMRDFFAGDENAQDPTTLAKQRNWFDANKDTTGRPTVQKKFRSRAEYEQWLKQNKLKQISDSEEYNIDEEAANLLEYLRKIHKRWAIVSKREGRPLVYFKGDGKPSKDWIEKQERRINYFKRKK